MSTKNTALKNTLDDIIILNLRERMRGKIILYNVMTIDYSCERENCRSFFAVCIMKALEFLLLNFAFFFAFSFFRHSWNYEELFSGWKLFRKKREKSNNKDLLLDINDLLLQVK